MVDTAFRSALVIEELDNLRGELDLEQNEVIIRAIAEIHRLRAEVEAERKALRVMVDANQIVRSHSEGNVWIKCDAPGDGYLPGLNSLMGDAPLRSPEEQFTRRMLREAISRCLFTGLPDEREWTWDGATLFTNTRRFFTDDGSVCSNLQIGAGLWDSEWTDIPAPIWDKAWKECGMEDR